MGTIAVPREVPHWNYQAGSRDLKQRRHVITCALAGMDKSAIKAVNCEKIKEITQSPDENHLPFSNDSLHLPNPRD